MFGSTKNVVLLSEIHPRGQEIRDKMNKSSFIGPNLPSLQVE